MEKADIRRFIIERASVHNSDWQAGLIRSFDDIFNETLDEFANKFDDETGEQFIVVSEVFDNIFSEEDTDKSRHEELLKGLIRTCCQISDSASVDHFLRLFKIDELNVLVEKLSRLYQINDSMSDLNEVLDEAIRNAEIKSAKNRDAALSKWKNSPKTKAKCLAYKAWQAHSKGKGYNNAKFARQLIRNTPDIGKHLESEKYLAEQLGMWSKGKNLPECECM